MSFQAAITTAYRMAKETGVKHYVWAFVETRHGRIVWTVTNAPIGLDFKDCHEWRDGRWHHLPVPD